MIDECRKLVEAYVQWLREKIQIQEVEGFCELTTPFLDRHNDHMQIYVKKTDNGLLLTDNGYTIADLLMSGVDLTEHRKEILNRTLSALGVSLNGESLEVLAKAEDFAQKKHNLLQAMIGVNDLFVTAQGQVASLFREDVLLYLEKHGAQVVPSVSFVGRSGFNQHFDGVIPKSKSKPERILRAIGNPNKSNISLFLFAWDDIRETRPIDSVGYAILNDQRDGESRELPEVIQALQKYLEHNVRGALWSHRDRFLGELVA